MTFQQTIPLLNGKYEIFLPDRDEILEIPLEHQVVKLGNGKLTIEEKKLEVAYTHYWTHTSFNESYGQTKAESETYKATKISIIVSNVMPLPPGSDAQPLGVKIITIPVEGIH